MQIEFKIDNNKISEGFFWIFEKKWWIVAPKILHYKGNYIEKFNLKKKSSGGEKKKSRLLFNAKIILFLGKTFRLHESSHLSNDLGGALRANQRNYLNGSPDFSAFHLVNATKLVRRCVAAQGICDTLQN